MNPNDIFWLARYAHTVISPLVKEGENLQIILDFGVKNPGLQIWVLTDPGVKGYKFADTKKQVDAFAATLQPLETGIAA